jgi:glycosyltransferase involved in cell wall biosynthesis
MAQALARHSRIATVGLLPGMVWNQLEPKDDSVGLEHELVLWDRKPELWHRWRSWRRLRQYYLEKSKSEGIPDVVLVRNLPPVYNYFIRWLRRQRPRPLLVTVLADSGLGQPVKLSRRFRYLFKPMQMLEYKAALLYDACLGFGIDTRRHFEPRGIPWQWMPSAFNFDYEPPPAGPDNQGPIRFGHFGWLSEQVGVHSMVKGFLGLGLPASFRVCGFGDLSTPFKELAAQHPNFFFDGLLPKQSDCLGWAQQLDVLVNPRLPLFGKDNTFPSKVFEFAMTGKAILSTRTGGVDKILGEEGLYLETDNFVESVRQKLSEVARMDRAELRRRGTAIRNRVLKEYNWDAQARRILEFLGKIVESRSPNPRLSA